MSRHDRTQTSRRAFAALQRKSAAALLVLVVPFAGCAGTGGSTGMPGMDHGSSSPGATAHSDVSMVDSMFVMMMIPHHEQAIEMSDTVLGKSGVDQRVLDLARQIKDAQGPEIALMKEWLAEWGMPASGDMEGGDHGDGMMSQEDMAALEAAEGAEAATLFLEQMIVHHEGAIDMAQNVVDDGTDPDVLALAESIIASQTAEIEIMRTLLADI